MKPLLITACFVTGLSAAAGTVLMNLPETAASRTLTKTPTVVVTPTPKPIKRPTHRFYHNGSRLEMEISQMSCYTEDTFDFFSLGEGGGTWQTHYTNYHCKINRARDIDTNEVINNWNYVICKSIYQIDNKLKEDNTAKFTTCQVAKELGFIN